MFIEFELRKTADNQNPPPVIVGAGAIFATIDKAPYKIILLLSGAVLFVSDLPDLPDAVTMDIEAGEMFKNLTGGRLSLCIRRDAIASAHRSDLMQCKIATITGLTFTAPIGWDELKKRIETPAEEPGEEPGEEPTEEPKAEKTKAEEPKAKPKGGKNKEGKK